MIEKLDDKSITLPDDKNLIKDIRIFVNDLVESINEVCTKTIIMYQNCSITADGLCNSYGFHEWTAATDASFVLYPLIPQFKTTDYEMPKDKKDEFDFIWHSGINDFIQLLEKHNHKEVDRFSFKVYSYIDKIWKQKVEFEIFDIESNKLYSLEYDNLSEPLLEML